MSNTFIVSRLSIFLNTISDAEFQKRQAENQKTTLETTRVNLVVYAKEAWAGW